MIRIVVQGDCIPAARPRFSKGHCYQPKRNSDYRHKVEEAARLAMKEAEPLEGEICAVVKVYRRYRPATQIFGDCDNHAKAICDALNGICYVDDRQIIKLVVEKYLDKENPRAVVEVGAIDKTTNEFFQNV